MNFDLNDDQRMLANMVGRLMTDQYPFAVRQAAALKPLGFSETMWARFAELGILGLPFPEALGGLDGTGIETMIVMEAFGAALVMEPYFASVLTAGMVVRFAGSEQQTASLLPRIASGSLSMAFAHTEAMARHDLSHVATRARREGDDWLLNGSKELVVNGNAADLLVVSARLSGETHDRTGLSLFLVDSNAPGVTIKPCRLQDGRTAADIVVKNVKVGHDALLGAAGEAIAVIERVAGIGIAALVAEAVGVMDAVSRLTVEYLKARVQFGAPIGQNQVLQHKAVDMFVATEQARSMAILAALSLADADSTTRDRNLSMAKALVGQLARQVVQTAVQLHGGIGLSEEYAVGHFLKRILVIEQMFGDSHHHLALVAKGVV